MSVMTKRKAFAIHLGISLAIFLILLFLIVVEWYPPPFFSSDGGWQGIRIIIGVDLVLGPLLTLIVFKAGKRGLKFDLTVIGIIQAGALSWGVWIVHHERPIAAVFIENYFIPVTFEQIKGSGITYDKLKVYGNKSPYWIYSNLPKDEDALQKVRLKALRMHRPLYTFTEFYTAMDANALRYIKPLSLNMPDWVKDKPLAKQRYEEFKRSHNNGENLIYLPWHARDRYEIIAINDYNGHYVGRLNIAPPTPMQTKSPVKTQKKLEPQSKTK